AFAQPHQAAAVQGGEQLQGVVLVQGEGRREIAGGGAAQAAQLQVRVLLPAAHAYLGPRPPPLRAVLVVEHRWSPSRRSGWPTRRRRWSACPSAVLRALLRGSERCAARRRTGAARRVAVAG